MDSYRKENMSSGSSVVDYAQFKENFVAMAPHLSKIDWNGVFLAGGSVLACLLPSTDKQGFSSIEISLKFQHFNILTLICFCMVLMPKKL